MTIPDVTVAKGTLVSRMTWDAISSVEDIGTIVVFWYDPTQGFFLPHHVFKDDASRIAFSTWAKERVRAVGPAAVGAAVHSPNALVGSSS